MPIFLNRIDAGRQLADALKTQSFVDGLILAIPRGGVVIGFEVAETLELPLDIIIPRKIGSPENPELAIGAMTEDGTAILDENLISYLNVSKDYIYHESEKQKQEIQRRMQVYRQNEPYPDLEGRDVIVVDDGIATGSTMKAALVSVKNRGAKSVIAAIPVGPTTTIEELKQQADRVFCLYMPEVFYAIGEFYDDFTQTSDVEVIDLLRKNRQHMS
ncbi:MAG: phosphoribosyltransferase [Candidatus Bathyarchaeota archaeon]|nr:phosphoribosyltransferase [Candidatus Termiticorpusculum sp.]